MDIVKWLREFKLSTSDSNYNALIVNDKTEEAANEIERLRQQVEDLALVARGAAYRIEDAKKSQRFLAMIDKVVGGK